MDGDGSREAVISQWVRQPPVRPTMQYLRDAEWDAALAQLGPRDEVLDVGSEARVTRGADAGHVTRVDFSPQASERARDVLGDAIDQFETTTPEDPQLPLTDDTFDGAVAIGPYDWLFLDVATLTDEIRRVVDSNGTFVVSVPTPNSPYAANRKNRSYTPAELLELLSPDWRIVDHDLVFQYPRRVHDTLVRLPPVVQEPFVDIAERLSDQLTERDLWDRAAYLVVAAEPLAYHRYLEQGIESLFRPVADNGFWDGEEEKIVRALRYRLYDGNPVWSLDDTNEWRYAPLALLGVMQWRASSLGDDRYDDRIRRVLAYFAEHARDSGTREAMTNYGVGPLTAAFALAATVFDDATSLETARVLYRHSTDRVAFTHAEDSLLLYGWATLYDASSDEEVLADLRDGLWRVNERRTAEGLYAFDNGTTRRHQNQMYALWGVCRAVEATGEDGYLDGVEEVLDYTVQTRMRDDGGIVWEDVSGWTRLTGAVDKQLTGRPPYWEYLYECHQTFFVNAVAHYYRAGGERSYDRAVRRAMAWIYGDNALGVDLVDVAGIGIPMRHLTTDGRLDEPYFAYGARDQRYKGTYEVGSYIMALTHLLDSTAATPPDANRPRQTTTVTTP